MFCYWYHYLGNRHGYTESQFPDASLNHLVDKFSLGFSCNSSKILANLDLSRVDSEYLVRRDFGVECKRSRETTSCLPVDG